MAQKDYQTPILTVLTFEKQDVCTLSIVDGVTFNAQDNAYGWWSEFTGVDQQ